MPSQPCTSPEIEDANPEMAIAVEQLARGQDLSGPWLLGMAGHQDGILTHGHAATATNSLAIEAKAKARQRS